MTNETNNEVEAVDENKLISQRREKLKALREKASSENSSAFPNKFRRDQLAQELHKQYDSISKDDLAEQKNTVKIAGRMMLQRVMGKASFIQVKDMSGSIQVYVQRDALPEGFYNEEFKNWDLGDIIGAEGEIFKTNKDELSVRVSHIELLTKSLRPLPINTNNIPTHHRF